MRLSEVTNEGVVERLRSSVDFPLPCPACGAQFTTLVTETTFRRTVGATSLQPTAALLTCDACAWKVEAASYLYAAWARSYSVSGYSSLNQKK